MILEQIRRSWKVNYFSGLAGFSGVLLVSSGVFRWLESNRVFPGMASGSLEERDGLVVFTDDMFLITEQCNS